MYTVLATAMPWELTILSTSPFVQQNSAYIFDMPNGTQPTIVLLRGAPAGAVLTVTYLSGTVDGHNPGGTSLTPPFQSPSFYASGINFQGELIGAFTDSDGNVISVENMSFVGLNGSMIVTVPSGATRLQLGCNWGGGGNNFLSHSGYWILGVKGLGPGGRGVLIINEPSVVVTPSPLVEMGGLTDQSTRLHLGESAGGLGGSEMTKFSTMLKQRGSANIALNVHSGDAYMPTKGTQIFLYDVTAADQDPVFSGTIDTIQTSWWGTSGDRLVAITCVSFEQCLDTIRVYPGKLYQRETAGFIFRDLLSLAAGSPIVAGTIEEGPIVDNFLVEGLPTIADCFDRLCKLQAVQFVWGVDPGSQYISFGPPAQNPGPWTVQQVDPIFEGVDLIGTRQDFRDRQILIVDFDAIGRSAQLFIGDGFSTTFTLLHPVHQVTNAWITRNEQNTATGNLADIPTAGDSVTISYPRQGSSYNWAANGTYVDLGQVIVDPNGHIQRLVGSDGLHKSGLTEPAWNDDGGVTIDNYLRWQDTGTTAFGPYQVGVYVWVEQIDNTQWGQVLIGATVAECLQNLIDAINCNDDTRGVSFSFPTWENPLCSADQPDGLYFNSFTLRNMGATKGSVAAVQSAPSTSHFYWSNTGTSGDQQVTQGGSTTFGTSALGVGLANAQTQGLGYTPGSRVVTLPSPLNFGTNLQVEYQRLDGNAIIVEDTPLVAQRAAIEDGTGKYHALTNDTGASAGQGLIEAQQALEALKVMPETLEFQTFRPGIKINQLLTWGWDFPYGPSLEVPESDSEASLVGIITIDHTKCGGADSTGFSMLFSGTYLPLRTVAHGGFVTNTSGFDITFSKDQAGAALLTWEIESYNPVTGAIIAWILLPRLSSNIDTVLYIQIGNPNITTFQGGAVGSAWNEYAQVLHLPDGATLSANDSSGYGNDGAPNTATAIPGLVDGAAGMDGTGQGMFAPNPMNVASGSIELWAFIAATSTGEREVFGDYSGFTHLPPYPPTFYAYGLGVQSIGFCWGSIVEQGTTNQWNYGSNPWILLAFTWDIVENYLRVWVNGQLIDDTAYDGTVDIGGFVIGGAGGSFAWHGGVDEWRVSFVPRNSAWMVARFNNEHESNFYSVTFGPQWIVQEVEGELVPTHDSLGGDYGIMRYTVRAFNRSQIGSYLDFWESLGGGSNNAGGGSAAFSSATYSGSQYPAPNQDILKKFIWLIEYPYSGGLIDIPHQLDTTLITVTCYDNFQAGQLMEPENFITLNLDTAQVQLAPDLRNTFSGNFPASWHANPAATDFCAMVVIIG